MFPISFTTFKFCHLLFFFTIDPIPNSSTPLASIAEFERELIRERVCAGVANARNKSKRLGRPGFVDLDRGEIAAKKVDFGLSNRTLAAEYGVNEKTIRNLLNGAETIEAMKAARTDELVEDYSIDHLFEQLNARN